jgi:hypothetical protein
MTYTIFHLKDPTGSQPHRLLSVIRERSKAMSNWGVFPGLFGLGTNEAYWVVEGAVSAPPIAPDEQIQLISQTTLTPTLRPETFAPVEKEGVYVFRWFELPMSHVEEVVQLSGKAWETFESGFDTEVQGLFTTQPPFSSGLSYYQMLLVTWYRDLSVWQDSRAPDDQARELFQKRQSLLESARPIATRLFVD